MLVHLRGEDQVALVWGDQRIGFAFCSIHPFQVHWSSVPARYFSGDVDIGLSFPAGAVRPEVKVSIPRGGGEHLLRVCIHSSQSLGSGPVSIFLAFHHVDVERFQRLPFPVWRPIRLEDQVLAISRDERIDIAIGATRKRCSYRLLPRSFDSMRLHDLDVLDLRIGLAEVHGLSVGCEGDAEDCTSRDHPRSKDSRRSLRRSRVECRKAKTKNDDKAPRNTHPKLLNWIRKQLIPVIGGTRGAGKNFGLKTKNMG